MDTYVLIYTYISTSFKIFKKIMCIYGGRHTSTIVGGVQKQVLDSLELVWQEVVSYLT